MNKRLVEKLIFKMVNLYNNKKFKLATIYSHFIRIIFTCDISGSVKIDESSQLIHNGLGCVFHPKTVIGKNCRIYQNVTIGGNGIKKNGVAQKGAPILEDNVTVFAGACVLGPIIIGEGTIIGANTVITKSVPRNSLVVGNPAIIKNLEIEYEY
ncbi:hypothetical protein MX022_03215 [Streptococcus uberis]|uniref:serine O-acetyltransferase n=1 Tax=Streptococcus uberis TaxID=1349 RepID=UPI001FF5881B|nr:hypothetical protein [Streptococcus uberis]MCK1166560.1 hypothetical protein [Streptococcus uberis]MCK1233069.1 hypothetical protein [Streptococcus uberis]MCK1250709.1 hypothetical protein [Streptococcus uberis]